MKQGGTRRGANMGILRVDHPDIMEFITCKEDLTQVTNFNISRRGHDEVHGGGEGRHAYDLIDPARRQAVVGQLDARMVWDKMIDGAWRTGEPGVLLHRRSQPLQPGPAPRRLRGDESRAASSRCSPYDVCNLGSINVGYYVSDGKMDWDAFRADIHLSTHFLDNIIDVNKYPLPEIDTLSKRIRRIGLGVMGFADALIRLGIAYDTPEGVEFGRKVMEFVDVEGEEGVRATRRASAARSRSGRAASGARTRRARATRTASASARCSCSATATSRPSRRRARSRIIAGCSSGLEPLFAVAFMRNQAGVMMPDVNEDFVAIAKQEGWYFDELDGADREDRLASTSRKCRRSGSACSSPRTQIAPEWHIQMQAAFQEHCDSAISKTTNFAHTATVDDVRTIYEMAYDMKCKGVTVYRDGSRDNQVLSTGATGQGRAKRATASRRAGEEDRARDRPISRAPSPSSDAEIERLKKAAVRSRRRRTCSAARSARVPTSCAARPSARRRRSA